MITKLFDLQDELQEASLAVVALRPMVSRIDRLRSAVIAEESVQRPPLTPAKQAVADQNAARDAAAAARHAAAAAEQAAHDVAVRKHDAEVYAVQNAERAVPDERHAALKAEQAARDEAVRAHDAEVKADQEFHAAHRKDIQAAHNLNR